MSVSSKKTIPFHLLRWLAEALLLIPFCIIFSDIISPYFAFAAFAAAAAAGFFLGKTRLRIPVALFAAAVTAFLLRIIIFTISGFLKGHPVIDFISFSFDSGLFPQLPFLLYFIIAGIAAENKKWFIPVEIIINAVIFGIFLWSQGGYRIVIFSHPGIMVFYSIIFTLTEIVMLLVSSFNDRRGSASYLAIIVPVFIIAVLLLFGRYSEGASRDGGGLMKPTLFQFDFSDYVKLESEISMDNDLVLMLRNKDYLNSVYLRRFYLSGYKSERGFFIKDGPGETKQLLNLPEKPVKTDAVRYTRRVESNQEYFIVNLDSSSLIAMNYPVEISPLTNWAGSSFSRNYRVISESVELPSWELSEAAILDMDDRLHDFYTDFGDDQRIKNLAEEITRDLVTPYDRVIAIMFYLQDNYYYSLKPGVAADGNQLHYFLFDGKKGYCSYFAFSMALLCRSIGIPARIAAGFFIDPQSGILNVYPVREDMAHAWVEVPFEDFGWVEFDPTSDRIAPGEELAFAELNSSEYSDLVEEIFANKYSIDNAGFSEDTLIEQSGGVRSIIKKLGRILRIYPAGAAAFLYALFLIILHLSRCIGISRGSAGRRLRRQYRLASRLAASLGCRRRPDESVIEHAVRSDKTLNCGLLTLAEVYLESVFAEDGLPAAERKAEDAWNGFRTGWKNQPLIRRIVIFVFPFMRFRQPDAIRLLILIFSLSVLVFAQPAAADEGGMGADFYLEASERERDSENYEAALRLLNEGISRHPSDWGLKKAVGDIYYGRELYNLALEYYNLALELAPDNLDILYSKSLVEGLLNMDEESIFSLEQILLEDPENYDALVDLGWMYFKTFRLKDAEELLLFAIDIYSSSPSLFMTLGTVYSGLYDYENARKYYLESIEMALDNGWAYFASISYYNLALLEKDFYRYEKSLEYTNKSIEAEGRATGYISRADMSFKRLDFEASLNDYQQAYSLDYTPLALMGLAELYITFGMLDEALANILEVVSREDNSWMYYFGVDPDRHRMETDRLLMETYRAMENREKFNPAAGFGRLKAVFNRIRFHYLGWFHERRYRTASYELGISNRAEGNLLDAAWAFYIANRNYPGRASVYLDNAESIETALTPETKKIYLFEEGRLEKDLSKLRASAAMLDSNWERRDLLEVLASIAAIEEDNTVCENLYSLNPAVFVTEGLRFPIYIDFDAGFFLVRALKRGGFSLLTNNNDNHYRYSLTLADNKEAGSLYSVIDVDTNDILLSIPVRDGLKTPAKAAEFTAELKERLFRHR